MGNVVGLDWNGPDRWNAWIGRVLRHNVDSERLSLLTIDLHGNAKFRNL